MALTAAVVLLGTVITAHCGESPDNNATATTLADGRVLFSGGTLAGSGYSNKSVLYDPGTEQYTLGGTMNLRRAWHKAFRLQDGQVLVVGGFGVDPSGISTVEQSDLYNPTTNTWTAVGAYNAYRSYNDLAALLLNNGKVLLVGGSGEGPTGTETTATCELYNPATTLWTYTGSLAESRKGCQLFLLSNGYALVVGGQHSNGGGGFVGAVLKEIYNPATELWHTAVPPVASDASVNINEDQAYSGTLTSTNPEGLNRTFALITPGRGTVEITDAATGAFTYTPAPNDFGVDTFSFQVSDEVQSSANATITVNIAAQPDAPVAQDQTVSLHAGTTLNIAVVATDADPGTTLTYSVVAGPEHGQLVGSFPNIDYLPANGYAGDDSFTFKAFDGGLNSNTATVTIHVLNQTPAATAAAVQTHANTPLPIVLTGTDPDNDALTFMVDAAPQHGTLTGDAPNLTYTPTAGYVGEDSFTFKALDPFAPGSSATITLAVTNQNPLLSVSATPLVAALQQAVNFTAVATDPDLDEVAIAWDFGDGTTGTGAAATHSYAAAGSYTVTAIASDPFGGSVSGTIVIQVSNAPIARFTTGDVVGFVGRPLQFDGSLSTDPENAIAAYAWNFGDGSPIGAGQQISRVYTAAGAYIVTLTVIDADGLTGSVAREIEILAADEFGLFNSFVEYSVKWDRGKTNADSLNFDANVNVGDVAVGKDSIVAVTVAGNRFEAKLDSKLRSKTKNDSWQVIANTKKQSPGEVRIKLKAKKASLGANFNQAGAVAGGNDDDVTVPIPVDVEIGGRRFSVLIDSDFKFSKDGKKASGSGEGP